MNLPVSTPTEALSISPEALEIANCYLQCQDIQKTAEELDIPTHMVVSFLEKREVKTYIDYVFSNVGFNNRFRMRDAMDTLIKRKFQELEESDTGSSKDIAELLALSHKMTMDELAAQIKLETVKQNNIKNQTNIQINEAGGSNYNKLIHELINGTVHQST